MILEQLDAAVPEGEHLDEGLLLFIADLLTRDLVLGADVLDAIALREEDAAQTHVDLLIISDVHEVAWVLRTGLAEALLTEPDVHLAEEVLPEKRAAAFLREREEAVAVLFPDMRPQGIAERSLDAAIVCA